MAAKEALFLLGGFLMSKHYIIPVFVPHLGCPHDCVFCNQKKITSSSTDMTPKDVENTIGNI